MPCMLTVSVCPVRAGEKQQDAGDNPSDSFSPRVHDDDDGDDDDEEEEEEEEGAAGGCGGSPVTAADVQFIPAISTTMLRQGEREMYPK
ncbi:hypothetical protein F2P81_000354 [Scophthalmus maximus]|uniref:Uncharacterized protein n=1 Tax=Scophthalmus maximus TaxID=52904 RepID=A0A6A4TVT1_SCOMX|nr:hypothetical protein F2P81_000354 [Scophthalmus maximus]